VQDEVEALALQRERDVSGAHPAVRVDAVRVVETARRVA
jgi:hypothetical protein